MILTCGYFSFVFPPACSALAPRPPSSPVCVCVSVRVCTHTHGASRDAHNTHTHTHIYILQHPALDCNFTQAVQITITMGLTLPRLYSTPLWIPSRIFPPLKIYIYTHTHLHACVVCMYTLPCACLSWLLLPHFSLLPLIFLFLRERQEGVEGMGWGVQGAVQK